MVGYYSQFPLPGFWPFSVAPRRQYLNADPAYLLKPPQLHGICIIAANASTSTLSRSISRIF